MFFKFVLNYCEVKHKTLIDSKTLASDCWIKVKRLLKCFSLPSSFLFHFKFLFFTLLMLQIGSSREKNVEIRVMLVASNDSLKKLTAGGATDPTAETSTTYKSTVYYHKNSPRWGELIKIDIPTECGNAHLRFHFMSRTSELRFNALQR